jgi:hypothetical protein
VGETRPDVNYDPTPPVNNTLQWTWVGHVPTYNRIGKIRAPAEDRTTMEPRVTTLDDTAVQIGSFTTVLDSVVTITLTISGCEPDIGPQSAGLVRVATFRNVGGVVTQVAPGTVELCTVRDDPAWDAFFDVSGTDVRFWVQNANVGNATPVFWTGSAVPVETIAPAVR